MHMQVALWSSLPARALSRAAAAEVAAAVRMMSVSPASAQAMWCQLQVQHFHLMAPIAKSVRIHRTQFSTTAPCP